MNSRVIAIAVSMALALNACSSGDDERIAELEAELEQLAESGDVTPTESGSETENDPPQIEEESPATTSTTTTTVLSKADRLQLVASEQGFSFSSGVIENRCGDYAVLGSGGSPVVLVWAGSDWTLDPSIGDFFSFSDGPVEGISLYDLTGDGLDELVVQVGGGMRSFGAVFMMQTGKCEWAAVPVIDSCGSALTYDSLAIRSGELVGSGFSAGCAGRDGVRFVWSDPVQRFIGRSSTREKVCDYFEYDEVMLPLTTCDEGWAVYMAQEHIFKTGIQLDVDGYFGPGTHRAVLQFQMRNNLEPTGIVDLETWGKMFPADWDRGYPDYDGDGISTPVEMSHS